MKVKMIALTAAIAALTCLAGMVLRWASPALVPFSILPIMVYLSGIILGPHYGALAMLAYVTLGLLGIPVFASAPFGGLAYLAKPTFGYILGYIGAAYVAGYIYKPGSLGRAALAALSGLGVIYVAGLSYLYFVMKWVLNNPMSVDAVLLVGLLPFLLPDVIKAGIAAWVGNEVVRRRQEIE